MVLEAAFEDGERFGIICLQAQGPHCGTPADVRGRQMQAPQNKKAVVGMGGE
jgi:hypothetical protein